MPLKPDKFWGVCLGWVFANLLGVATVGVIRFTPLTAIPGKLVSPMLIGLPIGLAQWIALRRVAPISVLWVFTIPISLILGLITSPVFAGMWKFLDDESILAMTLFCMIIGLLVGLAQWLFLRAHFNRSLIWVLPSAGGFGLAIAIVLATNLINQSGIASIILITLVYAIATGGVLSWLLSYKRNPEINLFDTT